jgi:hypothetical protein
MACNNLMGASMAHSGLDVLIALGEAEQRRVIGLVLDVAYRAFLAADNSEDDSTPDFIKVNRSDFDALSDALDKLDELPDDQPGYVMEGPAKARWALRALLLSSAGNAGVEGLKP